jgi:hypothetical protein
MGKNMTNDIALLHSRELSSITHSELKLILHSLKYYNEKLDRSVIIKLQHLIDNTTNNLQKMVERPIEALHFSPCYKSGGGSRGCS